MSVAHKIIVSMTDSNVHQHNIYAPTIIIRSAARATFLWRTDPTIITADTTSVHNDIIRIIPAVRHDNNNNLCGLLVTKKCFSSFYLSMLKLFPNLHKARRQHETITNRKSVIKTGLVNTLAIYQH